MTSSFLSRAVSNSRFQFAATAVVSGTVVASAILGYQRLAKEERLSRLKSSIPSPDEEDGSRSVELTPFGTTTLPNTDKEDLRNAALARRALAGDFDEELIAEQLARNAVFLGVEGLGKLRDSFVVVVGCGGVGSHCAASLVRSGVGRLRLIDFDNVSLSSLNRHSVATLADVGTQKVGCLRRRLVAVAPWCRFSLRAEKFDGTAAMRLLGPWREEDGDSSGGVGTEDTEGKETRRPDFVVDAIDNIDTKVELLRYCYENGIPVVSSMGAGCKSDPTRVMVGDIGASTDDALSRATRRRLKLLGITSGIPVVFSTEKGGEGKAELLPLPEVEFQKGSVGELGVLPDFRVRILPVLGTMPAVFGYTLANHVILSISGYPTDYAPKKGRDKLYDQALTALQSYESKLVRRRNGGGTEVAVGLKMPITSGDIAFLIEEVFRGRSAITGISTRLNLTRWRRPEGNPLLTIGEEGSPDLQKSTALRLGDLVCMTKEEATRHQKEIILGDKKPEDLYDAETIARVEARLKEALDYEKYR